MMESNSNNSIYAWYPKLKFRAYQMVKGSDVLVNQYGQGFLFKSLTVIILVLSSLLIHQNMAFANVEKNGTAIDSLEKNFIGINNNAIKELDSPTFLRTALKDLNELKLKSADKLGLIEQELSKTEQAANTLGDYVKGEPAEVSAKRKQLVKEKKSLDNSRSRLKLLLLQIDELIQITSQRQKQQLATHLFAEGSDIYDIIKQNWSIKYAEILTFKTFLINKSGINLLGPKEYVTLSILFILALISSLKIRKKLVILSNKYLEIDQFTSQLYSSLLSNFSKFLPYLLITGLLAGFVFYVTKALPTHPLISYITYALFIYFIVTLIIQTLFSSRQKGKSLFAISDRNSISLCRRLHILLMLALFGYILFSVLTSQNIPNEILLLTRSIYLVLLVINLIWLVWLLRKIPRLKIITLLPAVFSVTLLIALMSDLLGYRNLSLALFRATLGITFATALFVLLGRLITDIFDGVNNGELNWQKKIRSSLGNEHEQIPGLIWARMAVSICLWLVLAWSVLHILGLSDQAIQNIYVSIVDGFNVGSIKIVPSKVLLALLVFAALYLFSSWLRVRLDDQWLKKSRIEQGSREAMVTIIWYVSISIAFLLSVSIAGVTFTNLTIIAGALSVGIGFGLQNIVNNFVSGLILLFERPVKRGDWIVVGDTEGYVKNIRIRSTQIETFDKADVIVPNSDLISNQVTNWMLYNNAGRVRIAIGIAYGSDTDKVKTVLEQVGAAHAQVITGVTRLEPKVLFIAFGESSLDFELRCHIKNIDNRFQVTSDLNFAIDKAFRKANIEIAFPQRDIHIRSGADQVKHEPDKGRDL